MDYMENTLCCEDYCRLRESVGWSNFSNMQAERALKGSILTVAAVREGQTVGMGRLIGDGLYYVIVDVVVEPDCQKMGIGSKIVDRMIEYVDRETPQGGRSSIQLIAEKGKELFYEKRGFKIIPHEFCGAGMRKVIRK